MTDTSWMTETERRLYAEVRAGAERDVQAERNVHAATGTRPHIFDGHEGAARKLIEHWISEGQAVDVAETTEETRERD